MNCLYIYCWQLMLGLPAAVGVGWEPLLLQLLLPKHRLCFQWEKPPKLRQKRRDPPWTSGLAPPVSSWSGRWASAPESGADSGSLWVFRDVLNKAEERGCHSMTVIKKNPLRPVQEKQSVLPRTFRQLWDHPQMSNCGSWTFLWWWNNEL